LLVLKRAFEDASQGRHQGQKQPYLDQRTLFPLHRKVSDEATALLLSRQGLKMIKKFMKNEKPRKLNSWIGFETRFAINSGVWLML